MEREPGWYWIKDEFGWCPGLFTKDGQWCSWRYDMPEEFTVGPKIEEPKE